MFQDRLEVEIAQEMKRRRDEDKGNNPMCFQKKNPYPYKISVGKIISPNGDLLEAPVHPREKHHRTRVKF